VLVEKSAQFDSDGPTLTGGAVPVDDFPSGELIPADPLIVVLDKKVQLLMER